MREHDWIWLEEAFEERAATFYRTGDSEPAEVFERLAATAANVPAVLMEQQQKLWDADAKAVARVWENVLNESDLPHRGLDGRGRSASNAQQDHGNPKPRDHRNGLGQIGHKRGALELTSRAACGFTKRDKQAGGRRRASESGDCIALVAYSSMVTRRCGPHRRSKTINENGIPYQ